MAFVWSFGVKFNCLEDAEKAKSKINKIILSDKTEIDIYKIISHQKENITLGIMIKNMQIAGNQKLLSYPFYYEIRDTFYQFLLNLEIEFTIALFEFEGADTIADGDIINYINQYGLGEVLNSDNCPDLRVSETIYQNKRLLDGLVLSNQELKKLKNEYSELFKPFKSGYYWLPI